MTMKKVNLSENLKDLEKLNHELHLAVKNGLSPEGFKELIEDYINVLDNVRLAYNDEHPAIINGIQRQK